MRIRPAGDHGIAAFNHSRRHSLAIINDALRIGLKFWLECITECDGFTRDDVHERSALHARENRRVKLTRQLLIIGQNHTTARAA